MWGGHVYANPPAKGLVGPSRATVFETLRQSAAQAQALGKCTTVEIAGTRLRVVPIQNASEDVSFSFVGAFDAEDLYGIYATLAGNRSAWTVVGTVPGIILTARPDGTINYYNRYWSTYTGHRALASRIGLQNSIAQEDVDSFLRSWRSGIEGRRAFALRVRLRRADGMLRWHCCTVEPLERHGAIVKWVGLLVDVHDEIEARERAEYASGQVRFLASASRALYSSFNVPEVASAACELVTRQIGTRCVMRIANSSGIVSACFPAAADSSASMTALLNESHAAVEVRPNTGCAHVYVPIPQRAGLYGAIVLEVSDPSVAVRNREMLADFGERVGLALENARLYDVERRIATTLQAQLLPAELPKPWGVHLDAAYVPCDDETRVGGDWYDAFELHDGRIVVTIGDVAGHGISASAMMGTLRHTIRASILGGASPAVSIALANEIVYGGEPNFATAFVGIIDPESMLLEWATAGHPPPLLLGNGGDFLSGAGTALGVLEDLEATVYRRTLPANSALVLYTDGVIEDRHDAADGMKRLKRLLEGIHDFSALGARDIAIAGLGDNPHVDDAATLVIAFEPVRELGITVPAKPDASEKTRQVLRRVARGWNFDDAKIGDLVLACGEALNNAIEHAYDGESGTIRVNARGDESSLVVTISDGGAWREGPTRADHGRGIAIMHALADRVDIAGSPAGTSVRMAFGVAPGNAATGIAARVTTGVASDPVTAF